MTAEVQSVGSGVYILSILWLISIFICIVSVRIGRLIGVVALFISSSITLLLILIPRAATDVRDSEIIYDKLFILRYCILSFTLLSILGAFGFFFVYYCMTPIETKKLRHWIQ